MLDSIRQEKRLDFGNDKQLNQKRQVRLKTCADVYDHWRSYKRLYKKAPSDGVEFHIDYIDTGLALDEEERSQAPIALALHGAPGSYHDFSLLINHLTKQKVRVIAPNFPEYIATVKTKVLFRHSADEKAAYLRDFLKAINVKKIDLLVSHSSAIFPTLLILLNANNEALARQRKQQQQQNEAGGDREGDCVAKSKTADRSKKARGNRKGGGIVSVESFSELGNRFRSTVLGLVDRDTGSSSTSPSSLERRDQSNDKANQSVEPTKDRRESPPANGATDLAADETNKENNETFEDAIDEIDDNNNQRHTGILVPEQTINDLNDDDGDEGEEKRDLTQEIHLDTGERDDAQRKLSLDDGASPKESAKKLMGDRSAARRYKRSTSGRSDVVVKFDEPIEIKAVALFNPAGHRLPKSMKPIWFKCGSVHVYQHKLGRSLFRKFGPAFLTVVGVPVRVDNMDNVMLSATVMRNSKCQRVVKQLEQLSQMKIPTLLVFSENDKLIEKEIFYEMTQFMRLDSRNFDVFNNDGDIQLSQSLMEDWIRVMVFKAGGHYAYSNYANTVNKAVSELLRKVTSAKCSI